MSTTALGESRNPETIRLRARADAWVWFTIRHDGLRRSEGLAESRIAEVSRTEWRRWEAARPTRSTVWPRTGLGVCGLPAPRSTRAKAVPRSRRGETD